MSLAEPMEGVEAAHNIKTVHVNNITDYIKLDIVRARLRTLFGLYGNVVDVMAHGSLSRKGQAFVIMESHDAAAQALHEIDGFTLFGKPLRCHWAHAESDETVRRERPDELEQHKQQRVTLKESRQAQAKGQRRTAPELEAKPRPAKPAANTAIPDAYLPPNKVLFLQNLAREVTIPDLIKLFENYPGYREVRPVPGRKNIAFVEFESEQHSTAAKEMAANLKLGAEGKAMKVTYART